MAIKEKDLPIAESLGQGDRVRIVTGDGDSKSIDAGSIGGGGSGGGSNVLVVEYEFEWASGGYALKQASATYAEIMDVIQNGGMVYAEAWFSMMGQRADLAYRLPLAFWGVDGSVTPAVDCIKYAGFKDGSISNSHLLTTYKIIRHTSSDTGSYEDVGCNISG